MSAGYAARLSKYPNKGVVGLPESVDSKRQRHVKLATLVEWVRASKHLVVLTGAGISTSAGIPDFRGPKGVWTLEKQREREAKRKRKRKRNDTYTNASEDTVPPVMNFEKAQPTIAHRAITKLATMGKLKYCVTQNVDGLHRRAGLSRDMHCSLHGCAFTEVCHTCGAEYFRDADVGGMSFQPTGNLCTQPDCRGPLHDTLLDWEDVLPEADFELAQEECEKADLVLCLGSSLRIEPAGSLPLMAKRFVIVNFQVTPKDDLASLILRAPVDEVLTTLLAGLGYSDWESEEAPHVERTWIPTNFVPRADSKL